MGSMGTLEFPNLRLWQHEKNPGDWSQPLFARDIKTEFIDAYIAQIQHLCDVVSAGVEPLINAQDGLMSLRATLAVARSAEQRIHIEI